MSLVFRPGCHLQATQFPTETPERESGGAHSQLTRHTLRSLRADILWAAFCPAIKCTKNQHPFSDNYFTKFPPSRRGTVNEIRIFWHRENKSAWCPTGIFSCNVLWLQLCMLCCWSFSSDSCTFLWRRVLHPHVSFRSNRCVPQRPGPDSKYWSAWTYNGLTFLIRS